MNTFWHRLKDKALAFLGDKGPLSDAELLTTEFTALVPHIHEIRGERHLLVWAEPPFWCVSDNELSDLIAAYSRPTTLQQLLQEHPHWLEKQKDVLETLRLLCAHRILQWSGMTEDAPRKDFTPIENISINVTRVCNLQCSFCYNATEVKPAEELTAVELTTFLTEVSAFLSHEPSLVILGGEPFLASTKLFALARKGRELGCATLVSTNGQVITKELAEEAHSIGLEVQVSLDGPNAKFHDDVRGKGTFDKAIEGVRTLVAAGVRTIISMVCHRENLSSLGDYFALASQLGVAEARFIPLRQIGGGKGGAQAPLPLDELLEEGFKLFDENPHYLELAGRDAFSIMANTCKAALWRPSCGTGLQTMLLDADGKIYPCINLAHSEFVLGSIKDEDFDFSKMWREQSKLIKFREQTSLENKDRKCGRCPLRHWCLGGCRGEVWSLTGKLSAPSPDCERLKKAVTEMFWRLTDRPDLTPKGVGWSDW